MCLRADARGAGGKLHAPTKDGKVKSFMDHEDSVYSESVHSTLRHMLFAQHSKCMTCCNEVSPGAVLHSFTAACVRGTNKQHCECLLLAVQAWPGALQTPGHLRHCLTMGVWQ